MFSNTTLMTAQIPSGFAMPTCGHAFDEISGRIVMSGARTHGTVVRDRGAVVTTLGYAEKSFPGTTAWRPPIR